MLTFGTIAAAVVVAAATFTLGWMLLDAYATRRLERAEVAAGIGATREWGTQLRLEADLGDTDTVDMYALRLRLDLDDVEEALSAGLASVVARTHHTLSALACRQPEMSA